MEKSIMHSFSESSAPLVKTTPLLLPGELIDEQDEQHPELYAVPITPPNLSISGKDIGLRPMSLEDFRKKDSLAHLLSIAADDVIDETERDEFDAIVSRMRAIIQKGMGLQRYCSARPDDA